MSQPRPYLYLGQTTSLCEACLRLVPAKIVQEGQSIFFRKRCPQHGVQKRLISDDADYFHLCRSFLKPGDQQLQCQSRVHYGCPFDCGLCPDHEQHSCLAILEVNEECNLQCPVCFADSMPGLGGQRAMAEIERMLDLLVASEGAPDLLQISGGEPTLHPQIMEIIALARSRPIRHLMLNTNGLRLARDKAFVAALAEVGKGFEVCLQFDSMQREALLNIRGADLRSIHEQALANLEEANISTTLVCVVKQGVNEGELGAIIDFALGYRCVRGVTFQVVQDCGRNDNFAPEERIVLSQVRRAILAQSPHFASDDLIPLPCNPEAICIGYGLRQGTSLSPLTRLLPREELLRTLPNSISFERFPQLRQRVNDLLSLASVGEACAPALHSFLCCLPQIEAPSQFGYDSVFRVVIVQFLDRFNFCLGGVKRSCIHFLTPAGKIVPFDTYNLFYRSGLHEKLRAGGGIDA